MNLSNYKVSMIFKVLKKGLFIYLIYMLFFGFLIFNWIGYSETDYVHKSPQRFFGDDVGPDKAVLIETQKDAAIARLHMLSEAHDKVNIAYYTLKSGEALDIFMGSLVETADRGVEVRLLLDGAFHNLRFGERITLYSLVAHENIEVRFFEEINFLKPWSMQNRLHDKFIIADSKKAIIGGRNIGNRYFVEQNENLLAKDRDVLIFSNYQNEIGSVIPDMENYFEVIWDSKYTSNAKDRLFRIQKVLGNRQLDYLRDSIKEYREDNADYFIEEPEFYQRAHQTNKVTFTHNPLGRLKKEPWVLFDLSSLMLNSKENIVVQSPYLVPTEEIKLVLKKQGIENADDLEGKVNIITNSIYINPNIFGAAGTYRYIEDIVQGSDELYYYKSAGSLHAKSYVFDEQISAIGAFNCDPRSSFLSMESMVVIHSQSLTEELLENLNDLMAYCDMVQEVDDLKYLKGENFAKRFLIRFVSIILRPIEPML